MASNDLIVGGWHSITLALERAPGDCLELWIGEREDTPEVENILALAMRHGVAVGRVAQKTLTRLLGDEHHQGIVLRRRRPTLVELGALLDTFDGAENDPRVPLLLMLDHIQDPRNFGACLRVADGAGVDAVIFPRARSAPISSAMAKTASGALDTVAMVCVPNLAAAMRELKRRRIWITGTDDEAEQSIYEVDFRGGSCIVVGNEGDGIRRLTRDQCDFLASIPMSGQLSSLNVATACAVTLYEARRQRLSE